MLRRSRSAHTLAFALVLASTSRAATAHAAPCAPPDAEQTALFAAANELAPGETCEIPVDLSAEELAAATGGLAAQWTDSGTWDPNARRIHWIGRDAGCGAVTRPFVHLQYDEAGSSWTLESTPPIQPCGHAYDHNALDPATGTFIHRPYGGAAPWALVDEAWSELPALAGGASIPAIGLTWFDELALADAREPGALVWAQSDRVAALPRGADAWITTMLPTPIGGYHNFAEYNPVHELVFFGGGNDAGQVIYTMDADGTLVRLGDAPIELGIHGGWGTYVSVDPVSGALLVYQFGDGTQQWWSYDVVTDVWAMFDGPPLLTVHAFQVPIPEYGVVVFWEEEGPTMYVYRHSPSDPVPPPDDGGSSSSSASDEGSTGGNASGDATSTSTSADATTGDIVTATSASTSSDDGVGSEGAAAEGDGSSSGCGCRSDGTGTTLPALALLLLVPRRRSRPRIGPLRRRSARPN